MNIHSYIDRKKSPHPGGFPFWVGSKCTACSKRTPPEKQPPFVEKNWGFFTGGVLLLQAFIWKPPKKETPPGGVVSFDQHIYIHRRELLLAWSRDFSMYILRFTFIYIYMHVYKYRFIHTHIYLLYVCIKYFESHLYTSVCIYTNTSLYIHTYIFIHMYTLCTYIRISSYTCITSHSYTSICMYTLCTYIRKSSYTFEPSHSYTSVCMYTLCTYIRKSSYTFEPSHSYTSICMYTNTDLYIHTYIFYVYV